MSTNDGGRGLDKKTSSKLYNFRGRFRENYQLLYKLMACTYCILTSSMVHNYNYSFVIVINIFYIVYIIYIYYLLISITDEYNLTNVVLIDHKSIPLMCFRKLGGFRKSNVI